MYKTIAVILGGGSGNRMNKKEPKAFLKISDRFLIEYAIVTFQKHRSIDEMVLIVPKDYVHISKDFLMPKYDKISRVLSGGNSRFESSKAAIDSISDDDAIVMMHDAARPFVSEKLITNSLIAIQTLDAVCPLVPVGDTTVGITNNGVLKSIDRKSIKLVQTPQTFKLSKLKKAQAKVVSTFENITDDFQLFLDTYVGNYSWIEGEQKNFKITYFSDFETACRMVEPKKTNQ
jgi:2-C-methyl-D-erythritol 4-phosphate cytidylyltransferase